MVFFWLDMVFFWLVLAYIAFVLLYMFPWRRAANTILKWFFTASVKVYVTLIKD